MLLLLFLRYFVIGICGTGKRQDIKYKRDPKCRDHEPIITISDCQLPKPCRNKGNQDHSIQFKFTFI